MADGLQPHHVTLCALLRLYLDPEELVLQLTPELYQRVGDALLELIRDSSTISFPSLPQLLTTLEVWPSPVSPSKDAALVRRVAVNTSNPGFKPATGGQGGEGFLLVRPWLGRRMAGEQALDLHGLLILNLNSCNPIGCTLY